VVTVSSVKNGSPATPVPSELRDDAGRHSRLGLSISVPQPSRIDSGIITSQQHRDVDRGI